MTQNVVRVSQTIDKSLEKKSMGSIIRVKKRKKDRVKNMQKKDTQVEAKLRKMIRHMINEAWSAYGPSDDTYALGSEEDAKPALTRTGKQRYVPKRKNDMMTDVDGSSFEEIAKELGVSVSGAAKIVDQTMQKVKFLFGVDSPELRGIEDQDRDLLVLIAVRDYIDFLQSSGELTDSDIDLLKNNPEIVSELDGFREFMSGYLKKAMKQYRQDA